MSRRLSLLCLLLSLPAPCAAAPEAESAHKICKKTPDGRRVCSELPDSICLPDGRGEVFCSQPGGGIAFDMYGVAKCGPGFCVRDQRGVIWCSSVPRGGAATDLYGNATCTESCVRATSEACVRPQAAE